MNRERVRAGYAIVVGSAMVGLWGVLLVSGRVAELETAPFEIWFHLVAELVTATALIASGVGLLRGRPWARWLLPIALGMLLYSVINAAGYYLDRRDATMVGLFAVLALATSWSIVDDGFRRERLAGRPSGGTR
ncbi:MAG: hypothetical protein ABEJ67_05170 [Halanaeroarchaeum sp.]